MDEKLIKAVLKPIAEYGFQVLRDDEKMQDVWEWLEDRANQSSSLFDDAAVAVAKRAYPSLVNMVEDAVNNWLNK